MARNKNKYQQLALQVLETRPILFNPDLSRALGSVTAGLFLSQLLYWCGKVINPQMIYKTVKEFEQETTLSKTQQLNAQKTCVRRGVLKVVYKGIPPKRNFIIDVQRLCTLLAEQGSRAKGILPKRQETRRSSVGEGLKPIAHFLPHITESTPKDYSKEFRTNSTEKAAKVALHVKKTV